MRSLKLLGVPKAPGGSGTAKSDIVKEMLTKWNIRDEIIARVLIPLAPIVVTIMVSVHFWSCGWKHQFSGLPIGTMSFTSFKALS